MGDRRNQKLSAEESQKFLLELLNSPDNRNCADCYSKGPRWASANLGLFVCIKCSGIHRSLGVHISQVRSVSLDKWTPEQLETMQRVGNAKGAEQWEASLPENFRRPTEHDTYALEQFIRDKYERKLYVRKSNNGNSTNNRSSGPSNSSKPMTKSEDHPPRSTANNKQQIHVKLAKSEPTTPATRTQHNHSSTSATKQNSSPSLIDWDAPLQSNTTHTEFGEFTSFSGPSFEEVEFSGFQSHNNSSTLPSPRGVTGNNAKPQQNTQSFSFDTEAAFFSDASNSNANGNAPKPSKESILSLYGQQSYPTNTAAPNAKPNQPVSTANYNVRLPGLGGPTTPTAPVGAAPGNVMYGYGNVPPTGVPYMAAPNQQMPTYVNPAAANLMMQMSMNMQGANNYGGGGYVNPNFQKMMMGGGQVPQQNNYASTQMNNSNFGF